MCYNLRLIHRGPLTRGGPIARNSTDTYLQPSTGSQAYQFIPTADTLLEFSHKKNTSLENSLSRKITAQTSQKKRIPPHRKVAAFKSIPPATMPRWDFDSELEFPSHSCSQMGNARPSISRVTNVFCEVWENSILHEGALRLHQPTIHCVYYISRDPEEREYKGYLNLVHSWHWNLMKEWTLFVQGRHIAIGNSCPDPFFMKLPREPENSLFSISPFRSRLIV